VHAINDLGWPFNLTEVAQGLIAARGGIGRIEITGYDPGYEEVPFPGLYDPATAGDVSPLLNAFETAARVDSPCPMVDAFKLEFARSAEATTLLSIAHAVPDMRHWLDDLSWSLLGATLAAADKDALRRSASLLHEERMSCSTHRRIAEAIAGAVAK